MFNKTKFRSLDLQTSWTCNFINSDEFIQKKSYQSQFSVRGGGTSISAASFGKDLSVIIPSLSKGAIQVDRHNRLVTVSTNVRLLELYKALIPHGLILRSVPSHPAASIGGCIGYNAHGQNHHRDGCFGDHVVSLKLFHPSYGEIILNKDSDNELFYLTIGGFGLTGIITEATIKIYPAVSNQVNVLRQNFLSIKDAYELFLENKGKFDFYHALFNLNYITKKRQPGYLEMAKIIEVPPSKESISCDGINSLHWPVRLNIFGSSIMRSIVSLYFRRKSALPNETINLFDFMHPSSKKTFYFSMFGNKGMIEQQSLIPHDSVASYLDQWVTLLCQYQPVIPLCHGKLFHGQRKFLNFNGSGFCIAIHVPATKNNFELLHKMDKLNSKFGCISNVVKDSRLSKETVIQQYQDEYHSFLTQLNEYDPRSLFSNHIAQKLLYN